MQEPSVGRIVHFYEMGDNEPKPAIVTMVHSTECVSLSVFTFGIDGSKAITSVLYDEAMSTNSMRWCWPPRVG